MYIPFRSTVDNTVLLWVFSVFIPPASKKVERGYAVFTLSICLSVHVSICAQNCVRSVSSTILVGSSSYLHILSSNFRRCVSCKVCFNIRRFQILQNYLNFPFSLCVIFTWDEAAGSILRTQVFHLL